MAVPIVVRRRRMLVEAILGMHESVQDELCSFRTGIVVTDSGPDFGTATACVAASQIADMRFDIHDVRGPIEVTDCVALATAPKDATFEQIVSCGYLFSLGGSSASILVLSVSNPEIDLRAVSDGIKAIDHDALVSVWPRTTLRPL